MVTCKNVAVVATVVTVTARLQVLWGRHVFNDASLVSFQVSGIFSLSINGKIVSRASDSHVDGAGGFKSRSGSCGYGIKTMLFQ